MPRKQWRSAPEREYKERDARITSSMMRAVRNKDSKAEMALRRELWRRGLRYRLHRRGLIGRPDIVFGPSKVVVFVDGDFWHARAVREHGEEALRLTIRSKNQDWWVAKLMKNVARDDLVTATLREQGWTVLRFWESEVLADPRSAARRVERCVRDAARKSVKR